MLGMKVAIFSLATLASVSGIFAACQSGVWPVSNSQYWTLDGKISPSGNGATMALVRNPSGGHGTKAQINSVEYVQYGNFTARVKPASGKGVITAFVLFGQNGVADPTQPGTAPVHDEIDCEVVGSNPSTVQTNYFVRGHLVYGENSLTVPAPADSDGFVTYGIDWNADRLIWSVNGNAVRTLQSSDTGGKYPTDSAQLQLSVWDAGVDEPPGTVAWAGGTTDWSVPEYDIQVDQIEVMCPGDAGSTGGGGSGGSGSSASSTGGGGSDSSASATGGGGSDSSASATAAGSTLSQDQSESGSGATDINTTDMQSSAEPTSSTPNDGSLVTSSSAIPASTTSAASQTSPNTASTALSESSQAPSGTGVTGTGVTASATGGASSVISATSTPTFNPAPGAGQVGANTASQLWGSTVAILASILVFAMLSVF